MYLHIVTVYSRWLYLASLQSTISNTEFASYFSHFTDASKFYYFSCNNVYMIKTRARCFLYEINLFFNGDYINLEGTVLT